MMNGHEKSDPAIVAKKPANNAGQPAAERVERRAGTDDNSRGFVMCRNIRTLHNFKPPATAEEIRASAVQFVRKLSGFTRPSKANEAAFDRAVDLVADAAQELLAALVTNAPPRDRDIEAAKARARTAERFRAAAS